MLNRDTFLSRCSTLIATLLATLSVTVAAFAQTAQMPPAERPQDRKPVTAPQPPSPPDRSTLSKDERRELRRQIREHGRDLYGGQKR